MNYKQTQTVLLLLLILIGFSTLALVEKYRLNEEIEYNMNEGYTLEAATLISKVELNYQVSIAEYEEYISLKED